MRIISFINEKGGVGNTTTVVNAAYFIAQLGYSVLMIDLDPQASATSIIGLGSGHVDNPDTFTSYDIFFGGFNPEKDILSKYGVDVIPADDRLAMLGLGPPIKKVLRQKILSSFLKKNKLNYDFVLIDCKGTVSIASINALVASTDFVVVMQAQYLALEGFPKLLKTINTLKTDLGICPKMLGILMTMFNKGHTQDVSQLEKLKNSGFAALLFNTIIRTNTTLGAAAESAVPVGLFDATCRGSIDYMEFTEELIERTLGGWKPNGKK